MFYLKAINCSAWTKDNSYALSVLSIDFPAIARKLVIVKHLNASSVGLKPKNLEQKKNTLNICTARHKIAPG